MCIKKKLKSKLNFNVNLINNLQIAPILNIRKKIIVTGNTINFEYKNIEGDKERIQYVEGLIISIQNRGISKTFKVRSIIQGIIVEQTFFLNSPKITNLLLKKKYKIRRSKLYFINKSKKNIIFFKLLK